MNEPFALSLGIFFICLALGHGCLHHFLAEENRGQTLPLTAALLPRPRRGVLVASIALLVALLFLFMAFVVFGRDSTWRAALLLTLLTFPLGAHVAWLILCCKKIGNTWLFVPGNPSPRTSLRLIRWALGIPAIVMAIYTLARLVLP